MIFETHTHFDDKAYDEDRDKAIKDAIDTGVVRIVNVAASMDSCKSSIQLAKEYPEIYAAVGVHPEECAGLTQEDMDLLRKYAEDKNNKVVAIGEIGLDYYWDEPERSIQKKWFIRQLELSKEVKLPIIVHSRDAAADTLDIIKSEHFGSTRGVIHCFSYGVEVAREYLNMGYYIGVGGVVTFKNGKKLKDVVEYAPIDMIVTETDSPYLTPVPNRGKRNTSANIPFIIEEIAKIKGIDAKEVEEITWQNACRLYSL